VRPSWDFSETRANSFTKADEEALGRIRSPLHIEAHLAPEDPRRVDLERHALGKLRRVLPDVQVQYVSATSVGIFEQTSQHYGEIWYELGGRRAMSRVTTAEGVLESIYALAGITQPAEDAGEIFRGHPLAVPPKGAAAVFYGIWPALVVAGAFLHRRRHS
jgi:MYXO-CTERM domain-containing protein